MENILNKPQTAVTKFNTPAHQYRIPIVVYADFPSQHKQYQQLSMLTLHSGIDIKDIKYIVSA